MSTFTYFSPEEIADLIPPGSRSFALMSSFAEEPGISGNLIHYLNSLARHFDALVLLATPERPMPNLDELPQNCKLRFVPNQCIDFGMWSRILHSFPHENYPELHRVGLINDSCFIVQDLESCFERARLGDFEFWGMVPCAEIQPHIQSYFMIADNQNTVETLIRFFREKDMQSYLRADKNTMINDFEVGLSRYMLQHVRLNTIFNYGQLDFIQTALTDSKVRDGNVLRPINMSHNNWDGLLAMGCPLLKRNRLYLGPNEPEFIKQYVQPAFYPLEQAPLDVPG